METYTEPAVLQALNDAADDILLAVNAGDAGLRDAVNLVVNSAMHYLVHDIRDLHRAIRDNYQAEPEVVLGWTRE